MKDEELHKLDLDGWPLPDEYLVELGRISALWASLESLVGVCIGKLAGFNDPTDPKPFILVNHTSFPQKLDILSTLCEQLAPEFPNLSDYPSVVSRIRAAQKARNRHLHNVLVHNPETGRVELAEASARGRLKTQVTAVTQADLRRGTVQIHEAQQGLYKLIFRRSLSPIWEQRSGG